MRSAPAAIAGLLLALMPILPGCGGEQAAKAGDPPPAGGRSNPEQCRHRLGDLLDSLESLNNSLAVGLSYGDYLSAVNHDRAAYASVEADHLPLGCLGRVAGPSEQSLNVYIEAADAWGDCLATTSCSSGSIEPKLQQMWNQASHFLAEAQSGLRELS
jgi:hypothetical protein